MTLTEYKGHSAEKTDHEATVTKPEGSHVRSHGVTVEKLSPAIEETRQEGQNGSHVMYHLHLRLLQFLFSSSPTHGEVGNECGSEGCDEAEKTENRRDKSPDTGLPAETMPVIFDDLSMSNVDGEGEKEGRKVKELGEDAALGGMGSSIAATEQEGRLTSRRAAKPPHPPSRLQ